MKTSELLAAKSSFEDNTKWLPFNVHALSLIHICDEVTAAKYSPSLISAKSEAIARLSAIVEQAP